MITETSRIDHSVRTSHRLILAILVLFAVPVYTAFGQEESAPKPSEKSSNFANECRKRYVEHEKHVQKLVTRLKTMYQEVRPG